MNKQQNSRLAMFVTTAGLDSVTHNGIIAKLPKFMDYMSELNGSIIDIDTAIAVQEDHDRIGALEKSGRRQQLELVMRDSAAGLEAYAIENDKPDIVKGFHTSENGYQKMSDKQVSVEATNLIKILTDLEAAVLPFGIGKTEIETLTAASEAFNTLMGVTRSNMVTKKGATTDVKTGFKRGNKALRHMDSLVNTLRTREPNFFNEYWNRRTIIRPPSRRSAYLGMILDSKGVAVKGAQVTVDNQPDKARTGKTGKFALPTLIEGQHVLRITHPGHQELLHTVTVTKGDRKSRERIEIRDI